MNKIEILIIKSKNMFEKGYYYQIKNDGMTVELFTGKLFETRTEAIKAVQSRLVRLVKSYA